MNLVGSVYSNACVQHIPSVIQHCMRLPSSKVEENLSYGVSDRVLRVKTEFTMLARLYKTLFEHYSLINVDFMIKNKLITLCPSIYI